MQVRWNWHGTSSCHRGAFHVPHMRKRQILTRMSEARFDWGLRVPGSETDSTEDPSWPVVAKSCVGAERPPAGVVRKLGDVGTPVRGTVLINDLLPP
ncbi:hypothetical protein AVEN_228644-1 [Araneus ventricosus]|uniref:Uncharacterized protein n=1 Tax=Araneus ventricosus TaxID=182803 RepID=A0A4Y2ULG4_ARAVE|nr:hypothetical protein AVEN_228644-1 [Araneus ventricosus]